MAAEYPTAQVHQPTVSYERLVEIGRDLLATIGEDVDRGGLQETPERFAKWWVEFITYDPGKTDTTFTSFNSGQMVVVSPMRVWSMCEHHLIPFWCDISIAYIPNGQVLGLSKFARIAHQFAHRLQIQEQLVAQIADTVEAVTKSPHVMVMAQGVHLCMVMRGIQTPGVMTSTAARGHFMSDAMLRNEFMQMVTASQDRI